MLYKRLFSYIYKVIVVIIKGEKCAPPLHSDGEPFNLTFMFNKECYNSYIRFWQEKWIVPASQQRLFQSWSFYKKHNYVLHNQSHIRNWREIIGTKNLTILSSLFLHLLVKTKFIYNYKELKGNKKSSPRPHDVD